VARAGDDVDAIDGADGHAGFAAGAHVFVEEGEDFGQLLFGHVDCRAGVPDLPDYRRPKRATLDAARGECGPCGPETRLCRP